MMQVRKPVGSDYYNRENRENKENKENKVDCGAPRSNGKPCGGGTRLAQLLYNKNMDFKRQCRKKIMSCCHMICCFRPKLWTTNCFF